MKVTEEKIIGLFYKSPQGQYSISDIVRELSKKEKAYYKNVYDAVMELEKRGVLVIRRAGRTSLVSLYLKNPSTLYLLSALGLKKKGILSAGSFDQTLVRALEELGRTAIVIRPKENIGINLLELLYITDESPNVMLARLRELSKRHNIKIASMVLTRDEFLDFLSADNVNPVRDALADFVPLSDAEGFWRTVADSRISEGTLGPIEDISDQDLLSNLSSFGYSLFAKGERAKKTRRINIESIIAASLMRGRARLRESVPVLLAKNRINYKLLLYVGIKYELTDEMGFLMQAAAEITKRQDVRKGLELFEIYKKGSWDVKTRNTLADIKETMEKYNAAG